MGFYNALSADVTVLSNRFIDEYMKDALGEFVKVYLYFVRHAGEVVTVESCARALDSSEKDVRLAIDYWKKAGVFSSERLEEDAEEDAGREAREDAEPDLPAAAAPEPPAPPEVPSRESFDMSRLIGDEDFSQLQYVAEQYMGKLLSQRDMEVLGYLYQTLRMPEEVLEYLMEYCAQNGHRSFRYVEKIALDWNDRGFKSAREARAYAENRTHAVFSVMKALGLSDRNPGKSEKTYIDRWYGEYGFSEELVTEACNRTIARIHKPSFAYVERILKAWKENGISTMEQVAAADLARDEKNAADKAAAKTPDRGQGGAAAAGGRARTRFHNFQGHGYDFDSIVMGGIRPDGGAPDAGGKDGTDECTV